MLLATASVSSGLAAAARTKPATATGRVLDVHGQPVAGAAIEVSITTQEYKSLTIGEGTTDTNGRFALDLSTTSYGDLGLGVEAPGFKNWGWAGFPEGIVAEEIVLSRVIDRSFLERLRSVGDREAHARGVFEIAASDDLPEIPELFPYLGELRPELAAIVRARTSEPKLKRDGSTPADHALRLLALRADPADDALVEPWMKEEWAFEPALTKVSGESIYQVCSRWGDVHFAKEGVSKQPPPSYCQDQVVDSGGLHAMALWSVRYMYWGYSMYLVMRREGDRWVLRGVTGGTIYHYRPAESTDGTSR
ncbi:MAG TPA: hypothetical protein VFS60_15465 [Thermoanaerobaculia bacterium]|nr:hypothetical protein [Thermoanaerobaculia bacterium]